MGLGKTISTIVAVGALLSACNTSDALIPRVGIGENSAELRSSPVTQDETERMAAAARSQSALATPPADMNDPAFGGQADANPDPRPGAGAPPGTLEDQADALRNGGRNPYQSAPLDDGMRQSAPAAAGPL